MVCQTLWQDFARQEELSERQQEQFIQYYTMLVEWNERINLTAITDAASVIAYHFQDSLSLARLFDLRTLSALADIGAGAGFPSIPLKIRFPHLTIHIIEVNSKRIAFLQAAIAVLGLSGIEIHAADWRTFLRKTSYDIPLFCARASLAVDDLLYVYKPSCGYKNALMVYWASMQWAPSIKQDLYIRKQYHYTVGQKERKLVVFSAIACII